MQLGEDDGIMQYARLEGKDGTAV